MSLKGKRITLGVTGGIGAYKAVEVLRLLVKEGACVTVVMTRGAEQFVTPLTFSTLSGGRVYREVFDPHDPLSHITLAQEADLILIAPATANTIGKIASGIADNLLTTLVMAASCPVLMAPAMNTRMYENSIVQRNIKALQSLGYHFIGPEEGELACGYTGRGRMSEPEEIKEMVVDILTSKDLEGLRVLVTAGPTREFIDPVRFISNPSTGKMGFAIARVAKRRGASVILVTGPTSLKPIRGVETIHVEGAFDMREKVLERVGEVDAVIMAAAVGDFYTERMERKIKREGQLTLCLKPTPDILKELGNLRERPILVGFAAETEDLLKGARRKLVEKGLDLVVANDLRDPDSGFGKDTNRVIIVEREGEEELPLLSKEEVAWRILDRVRTLWKRD